MKIELKKDYVMERRKNYMPVGDQLDAIYELAKYLKENDEKLPEKVVKWINEIECVKKKVNKI